MTLEIIVGVIAVSFILLTIFSLLALQRLRKAIKKTDQVLTAMHHLIRELTDPSIELIENANELVVDVKKKSEGLDMLFHPLYRCKKEKLEDSGLGQISDLLRFVSEGIQLFKKLKHEMKK